MKKELIKLILKNGGLMSEYKMKKLTETQLRNYLHILLTIKYKTT